MSGMLYEVCSACKGTGYITVAVPTVLGGVSGKMVTVKDCTCKKLRVVETGATSGQLERAARFQLLCQENGLTEEILKDEGVRKCLKRSLPAELTDPIRQAIALASEGERVFSIAWLFRSLGKSISKKAADERDFVLHWALGLALEHGEKWQQVANDQIQEMTTKAEEMEKKPQ
ncbi:MAG TPA: hypothetical protein VFE62_20930 [Gemmataceae bacterium]|nr:hypothetical protein [Gemmataceae bacterium]